MDEFCQEHSGIKEVLHIVKDKMEEIQTAVSTCLRTSTMWAFLTIFVIIALAVVGFLWGSQSKISDKVFTNHTENIKAIGEVREKFISVETKLDDWMKQNGNSKAIKK